MDSPDFKDLWNKQATAPQPSIEDLLTAAQRIKNKSRNQMMTTLVLGIATIAGIIVIGYFIEPKMITTRLGILLIIAAIIFFLVSSTGLLRIISKDADNSQNTSHYLDLLIRIKAKQLTLGTRIMTLYFISLGIGILLYMFEYASLMPLIGGITAYAVTIAWILFNWIYLKPRVVGKQQAKISEVIKNLEKVNKQLL